MLKPRQLGLTDLSVSPIGLGTVKFGRNQGVKYPEGFELPSDEELVDLLALAKNLGINMLDTAPAYGTSEERLGNLLKGQREDWVIVGKAGEEFEDGESYFDFTPSSFEKSLERTLKRLNTDYIDALLIHSDGNDEDILSNDALIKKLYEFKSQGLVKAIGASTKTVTGGLMTLDLLDIVMATYNPTYTDEKAVLDHADEIGKGVLLKKVFASGHHASPAECLKFAFDHPGTSAAIIGTINPKHLKENVEAALSAIA